MPEEGDPRVEDVAADLISRARAGDAFRELTEPHRRELQVHCYRMLGSVQDAEDVLQETLLAAWQGFAGFEGRASLRTWLYRIATNRCLNARRSASRRLAKEWDVPMLNRPSRPASVKSPGSSRFPTPCLRASSTRRSAFCASIFRAGRRFDLVPTRANGQPAFGAYLRAPNGISHGIGLYIPRFVRGLHTDLTAVINGLTLAHNSGAVEVP